MANVQSEVPIFVCEKYVDPALVDFLGSYCLRATCCCGAEQTIYEKELAIRLCGSLICTKCNCALWSDELQRVLRRLLEMGGTMEEVVEALTELQGKHVG